MAATSDREYEIVVFGATGFTGKLTSEHVVTHLPTDLKWAVAGRSEGKLQQLVKELQASNPDRLAPGVETATLDKESLKRLAAKTKVLVSTVGPYHLYGEAVVAACAEGGTHYLDVTGESPWVLDMIRKYDSIAKANNAIIIPQIGIESAPADLLAWSMVTHARRTLSSGIKELVYSVYDMKGAPSGGTLATAFGIFDAYSFKQIMDAGKPFSLSTIPAPPQASTSAPLAQRLLGVRTVRDLGTLTTSLQGGADATIVHRSWSLFDQGKYYGPGFIFSPYVHVRNFLTGIMVHAAIVFGTLFLLLSPVRWLLKKLVYQPGQGPSKQDSKHDHLEYRALATVDSEADPSDPKRITARMRWEGDLYYLTGVFLAEGAITLARDETFRAREIGGGLLTPATLGAPFLERLQKAGLVVDVRVMP
ncbi:hypothetical protein AAFC00_003992 [Neodothiora populina]|uniref:Saccharopine dehydrogenase NADP binding domain-containing protein n=1 Tax=Neodothiora populina TaxID=2781224 RepID=A0ABR3PI65_9PEZI